jgi:hypothetical protein
LLNAHWAFHEAPKQNDFLQAITVPDSAYKALLQARNEIRATLKMGLSGWQAFVKKDELFEHDFIRGGQTATLRPRFRMQGSGAYNTLNDPAQTPPQEIDLDDGVFMPTEFINSRSGNRPIMASKGYFRAVEAILKPLCDRKGWKLITENPPRSCVRIQISTKAHIDLPLYAIPSAQFFQLAEDMAKRSNGVIAYADSEELIEDFYRELPMDQAMLAHREHGWEPSDPRKIEDWYSRAIKTHGPVLRRLTRYYKGWRDFQWQKSKLSSLAIMACIVDILDDLVADFPNSRDDVAMLFVSERLAARLNRPIPNPVMTDVIDVALDREWTALDRADIVAKAKELHARLVNSLKGTDNPSSVLAGLRAALGKRVTDDVSVIRFETREATIKSFPKVAVAAPIVGRSTSG